MTTDTRMCAFCKEKPAIFDAPLSCSACYLTFIGLLGAVTQKRLEAESDGSSGVDSDE